MQQVRNYYIISHNTHYICRPLTLDCHLKIVCTRFFLLLPSVSVYLPKFDECRPACEELTYDATLSSAPLLAEEFDSPVQSLGVNPKYLRWPISATCINIYTTTLCRYFVLFCCISRNSVAIVHVYFEEGTVIKYVRSELFTSTQIIGKLFAAEFVYSIWCAK